MIADRTPLFAVAALAGLLGSVAASRCAAATGAVPPVAGRTVMVTADDDHDAKGHEAKGPDADKEKHKDEDQGAKKERKEIEQSVPMNMVPQPVVDAVMKECPGGKVTEAELQAKKGKIMWAFDVTVGEAKYDVKVTVDGKFYSKKVDADEKDEKDDVKDEKAGEKADEKH